MYEQIEKPKENKNKSIANSVVQKKNNNKKRLGFVGNLVLQKVQDFDFLHKESDSDDSDDHDSGSAGYSWLPQKGMLIGDTEAKYEAKIESGTNRFGEYWKNVKQLYSGSSGTKKAICQMRLINRRDGGGIHDYVYNLGLNNNINFALNLGVGGDNPIVAGTQVDLTAGCAVPNHGVTLSGLVVPLSPAAGGTRPRHFSIADRIDPAARAMRPNRYTWHHLDAPYHMVLIDSNVHNPGYGGFFHWGGMAFWP